MKKNQSLVDEEVALDAIVSTPYALEMRQRNSLGTNYASPNLYASIPPDNAPGLIIYTGNFDIQTVTLGTGLQWTPEDDVNGIPGRLDVTVAGGVNADWNSTSGASQILNRPTLAAVATSGAYSSLSGLPTLGTAAAQNTSAFATAAQGSLASTAVQPGSLATVATTGNYSDLTGRPTLGTAAATAATDYATAAQGVFASSALQPSAIGVSVQAFSPALATFSTNGSAFYLNRANHTGTQGISTVTGLQTALDAKFNSPSGTTAQYIRGDGSSSAFPTLVSTFSNDAGYLTSASLSGYVTSAALTTALGSYVTSASLTTTLSGYVTTGALTAALAGKFNAPSGTTAQYLRGDGSLATFPTIPTVPSVVSAFTNDSGYITSAALSPYATTAALTSGLAGKFNTPAGTTAQYVRGDGSLATLPTTTAPTPSGVTRTLNSAFQISATRAARVFYPVTVTTAFTLTAGQVGHVYLDYADDSGMTTNLESFGPWEAGQTGALAIGISINQPVTVTVEGYIPPGKYVRIRTVNNTGTPTFTSRRGQEVLQ